MNNIKATSLLLCLTFFLMQSMSSDAQWSLTGNTPSSGEFLGTTDASHLRIRTSNTERMVVLSDGNIGIGITAPAFKLDVDGVVRSTSGISYGVNYGGSWDVWGTFARFQTTVNTDGIAIATVKNNSQIRLQVNNGARGVVMDGISKNFLFMGGSGESLSGIGNANGSGNLTLLYSTAANVNAEGARLTTSGNFLVGTATDGIYKLDVNGTARFIGAVTMPWFSTTASSYMQTANNTSLVASTTGGTPGIQIADNVRPSLTLNLSGVVARGIGIINANGDIGINVPTFSGATTHILYGDGKTLLSNNVGIGTTPSLYKLDVNGTAKFGGSNLASSMVVTASGDIGIGMEPQQDMAFQVRKNANTTVGIRFENINTGGNAFTAVQLGQDITTTGTKFLNIGYANPDITPLGVYQPSGSFIVNNGDGGLNMSAYSTSGNPKMRFFTGNGVDFPNMRMLIDENGQVGIGTTNLADNNFRLFVETGIRTRKIKVDQTSWPDYVFYPQYRLPSLQQVEAFIRQHNRLPDMPSASEVEKEGLDLGDNQALLLKKIEELTLYVIDQNKRIEEQQKILLEQKERIEQLEKSSSAAKSNNTPSR